MASQLNVDASIVVSGEGFTSETSLQKLVVYFESSFQAPIAQTQLQEDGTVMVEFANTSEKAGFAVAAEVCRQNHSIATGTVQVPLQISRAKALKPPPRGQPGARSRAWVRQESKEEPGVEVSVSVSVSVEVSGEDHHKMDFICSTTARNREFRQALTDCDNVKWDKGRGTVTLRATPSVQSADYWKKATELRAVDELGRYKVERIRVTDKMSWDNVIEVYEDESRKHGDVINVVELSHEKRVLVVGKEAHVQLVCRLAREQLSDAGDHSKYHQSREQKSDSVGSGRQSESQEQCLPIQTEQKKRPIVEFVYTAHRSKFKRFIGSCSSMSWNSDTGILSLQPDLVSLDGSADKWSHNAKERVHDFLQKYLIKEILVQDDREWDRAMEIAEAEMEDTDNFHVVEVPEHKKIQLVGLKEDVQDAYKTIKDKLSRVKHKKEEKPQKQSSSLMKRISADTFELVCRTESFTLLQSEVKLEYNPGMFRIDVSGQNASAVDDATSVLDMLSDDIHTVSISVESHLKLFLSSGAGLDQFNSILASRGIIAKVVEVDHNGAKVLVKDGEQGKVRDELRKWLHSATLEVDDDTGRYLDSSMCQQFLATVRDDYGVELTYAKGPHGVSEKVLITGQKDKTIEAKQQIIDHLSANVETCESRPLPSHAVAEFLQKHTESERKEIERKLSIHQVRIEVRLDASPPVIVFSSKKAGFLALSRHVSALVSKCTGSTSKEFKKHGLQKFVQTPLPSKIEKDRRVVIKVEQDLSTSGYQKKLPFRQANPNRVSSQSVSLSKVFCSQNANNSITLYSGDICHHVVDAIVSTANEELDFSAGLPAYLVQCGGDSIEKQCRDSLSKQFSKQKLETGTVISTNAGRLTTTSFVIHAVGPRWPNGAAANSSRVQTTQMLLRKTVHAALDEAARLGCSSVALPAISAGGFGCPSDFVAQNMVEVIDEFLGSRQNKKLCDVHIVLLGRDQANIQAFQTQMMAKRDKNSRQRSPMTKLAAGATSSRTRGPLKVVILQGDITVQQVDVIVNSVSNTLDLQAAQASKVLALRAGPGLQQECSAYVNSRGSLKDGDVVITKGYSLQCKHVLHAYHSRSKRRMEEIVSKCMQMADDTGAHSIAFPAMGTGFLGMGEIDAANCLFEGIHGSKTPANLQEVVVVIFDSSILSTYQKVHANFSPVTSPQGLAPHPTNTDTAVTLPNGVKVIVEQGNVATEVSDAIVVPVGIVFNQVYQTGGQSLQSEWKTRYNSSVKSPNDFAELSGGGDLMCKKVYVIAPAAFNSKLSTSQNEGNISVVVEKVLMAANQANMSWISIPTIGTGNLGYSNEDSARAFAKAFTAFSSKVRQSHIQGIKVVVFEHSRLATFEQELGQICRHGMSQRGPPAPRGGFTYGSPMGGTAPPHPSPYSPPARKNVDDDYDEIIPEEPESVSISIVGGSQSDCNLAMADLVKMIDEWCVEKPVKLDIDADMVDIIRREAGKLGVCVKVMMENNKPKLLLAGMKDAVSDVKEEITQHMSEMQEIRARQREEDDICSQVQWLYENDRKQFTPYPPEAIVIIEKAYQQKQKMVQLSVSSFSRECTVNLMSNQELDRHTGQTRRIQREKKSLTGLEIPGHWAPHPSGTNYSHHLVLLDRSSSEYKDVAGRFLSTATKDNQGVTPVPPQPNIVQIERVQNPRMYHRYLQEKEVLRSKRAVQLNAKKATLELELFHGTSGDVVEHIISEGFNRSYAGVAVGKRLGAGVYFAKNSGYSLPYAKPDEKNQKRRKMFLCKVLLGMWTKGEESMWVPPVINQAVSRVDRYDSTVDHPPNPSIFAACFRDNRAYPVYIITYKHG